MLLQGDQQSIKGGRRIEYNGGFTPGVNAVGLNSAVCLLGQDGMRVVQFQGASGDASGADEQPYLSCRKIKLFGHKYVRAGLDSCAPSWFSTHH